VRVSARTDIDHVRQQIAAALRDAELEEPETNITAILELLVQTITRLQDDLSEVTHQPNNSDTRMSVGDTLIRVTAAPETLIERLLNKLLKNRVSLS